MRNPLKQWKITESDITEPTYYEQYMEAYEALGNVVLNGLHGI